MAPISVAQSYVRETKFIKGDSLVVIFTSEEDLKSDKRVKIKCDFTVRIPIKQKQNSNVLVNITISKKEKGIFNFIEFSSKDSTDLKFKGELFYSELIRKNWVSRISYQIPLNVWINSIKNIRKDKVFATLLNGDDKLSFTLSNKLVEKGQYVLDLIDQNKLFQDWTISLSKHLIEKGGNTIFCNLLKPFVYLMKA